MEAPGQILKLSSLCIGPVNTENLSVLFNIGFLRILKQGVSLVDTSIFTDYYLTI